MIGPGEVERYREQGYPAFLIRVVVVRFVRRWLSCVRVFVVGGLGGHFRGASGRSAVWRWAAFRAVPALLGGRARVAALRRGGG